MDSATNDLTWPVHEDYRVADGVLQPVGDETRTYDPLAHQEVISEYAKLNEGDEAAVVQFARTWGLLGWKELTIEAMVSPVNGDRLPWLWGHARNVRLVLRLYHYLQKSDTKGLSQFLDSHRAPSLNPDEEDGPLISIELPDGLQGQQRFSWGEPATRVAPRVAEEIIAAVINNNLQGRTHDTVLTRPLRLIPDCPALLIAVYQHLARVVAEDRVLARCQECSALFVVTDRRQKYCPPSPDWKGRTGSLCGARDRKRRQRRTEGG